MTRKSVLYFCLALGAFVPGCQLFPARGNVVHENSVNVHDHGGAQPDRRATANANAEPERVVAKTPQVADHEHRPLPLQPLDSPSPLASSKPETTTGIVTIEEGTTPTEPKNAFFQIPSVAGRGAMMEGTIPTLLGQGKREVEPVEEAFHLIFRGDHQEAIKILKAYPESTQEFYMRILPLLAQIARKSIDNMSSHELANVYDQARGLQDFLRMRCELLVSEMAYCKRIRGFGDYELLPDNHAFLAKTDNRPGDLVQLYVELKNFASQKTKEGDYLTKLACSLELQDMQGNKVWAHAFDKAETTHRKSACVNDYHANFSFYVPALPVGTYRLTFQVVDETIPDHRRFARKSQVFRVTPVANALAPR